MEMINYEGVNLAELLPRIPDSIKDGLPFGLVKLDLTGKILEYNMAESELTGVSADWAIGKNFFDEVALCTKTQAFYGRFVEGVKRGFLNAVFDYTFDHQEIATKVKVHMVTIPNHLGQKNVMILVRRSTRPVVMEAVPGWSAPAEPASANSAHQETMPAGLQPMAGPAPTAAQPSIQDIVSAVLAAINQQTPGAAPAAVAPAPAPAPAHVPAPAPAAHPSASAAAPAVSGSRHEDILKF
jgi:photoactive yellow protein